VKQLCPRTLVFRLLLQSSLKVMIRTIKLIQVTDNMIVLLQYCIVETSIDYDLLTCGCHHVREFEIPVSNRSEFQLCKAEAKSIAARRDLKYSKTQTRRYHCVCLLASAIKLLCESAAPKQSRSD
jgi:hypothetical protein